MAIKKLLQIKATGGSEFDEAFLRTPAKKVEAISGEVNQIIDDLRDTMWAYPICAGLSAPQIGYPYAISVIKVNRESRDEDLILINPTIISTSGKKDKKRESCMSLWGDVGEVERRDKISLDYFDGNFNEQHLECSGYESRTIQHEIDHLNGILYIDRMNDDAQVGHADFFDKYQIIE